MPASHLILFQGYSREKKLLSIENNQIIDEHWPYKNKKLASVWIDEKENLYVCGSGIFKRQPDGKWIEHEMKPVVLNTHIRGNASNDFYVVGHFGFLKHFNGKTWRGYTDFHEIDLFNSLDVKGETVVAVGYDNGRAVIYQRK